MKFRSPALFVMVGVAAFVMILAGCVDIPSEGHTPPDFKAQIRVMYLDPGLTSTATIAVASGPDFATFETDVLPAGAFGFVSGYSTVDAGGKQLLVAGDPDTSALSFASDQRGSLLVLPRPDLSTSRFLLVGEGRIFEAVGITGASRVLFANAITRGAADTADVSVDIMQVSGTDTTVAVAGLAFRAISGYIEVAEGETASFYLTRSGTGEVLTDAVSVTGMSNRDYTIVGMGSADSPALESFQNG